MLGFKLLRVQRSTRFGEPSTDTNVCILAKAEYADASEIREESSLQTQTMSITHIKVAWNQTRPWWGMFWTQSLLQEVLLLETSGKSLSRAAFAKPSFIPDNHRNSKFKHLTTSIVVKLRKGYSQTLLRGGGQK